MQKGKEAHGVSSSWLCRAALALPAIHIHIYRGCVCHLYGCRMCSHEGLCKQSQHQQMPQSRNWGLLWNVGSTLQLVLVENKDDKACMDSVSAYVIPICNKVNVYPYSKFHGANMGPIWERQDPGGSHVGPMNFAIWVTTQLWRYVWTAYNGTFSTSFIKRYV